MTIRPTPPLQPFVPAALAASRVGTWEYDVVDDRFRYDTMMAALYGLPLEEGERGLPIARIRAAIHPEDLPRHLAQCGQVFRHGGLFVIEYRTRPREGEVRWALLRGFYEVDAQDRVVVGRGIVIDETESKQDGYAEGRAQFLSSDHAPDVLGSLDHLADLVLQARRVIDRIGGLTASILRPLADALLFGVGRQIASRFDGPDDVEAEPESLPERRH